MSILSPTLSVCSIWKLYRKVVKKNRWKQETAMRPAVLKQIMSHCQTDYSNNQKDVRWNQSLLRSPLSQFTKCMNKLFCLSNVYQVFCTLTSPPFIPCINLTVSTVLELVCCTLLVSFLNLLPALPCLHDKYFHNKHSLNIPAPSTSDSNTFCTHCVVKEYRLLNN